MEKILYYSVQNCGDGSAYPQFFENERLTEMDQDIMYEGWGECCNGSIVITGDNIQVSRIDIITIEEFKKKLQERIEASWTSKGEKETATEYLDELNSKEYAV